MFSIPNYVSVIPSASSPLYQIPLSPPFSKGETGGFRGVLIPKQSDFFSYPLSFRVLPTILLILKKSGEGRIRTSEGFANRFTVCPLWPLGYLSTFNSKNISHRRESNPRPEVYKTPALPLSYGGIIALLSQP